MLLIENGLVVKDGTSRPRRGHVVVQDGRVAEVTERDVARGSAFRRIIDAEGKIVMPGLINGHTHSYANFVKALVEDLPLETMMFHIMAQGAEQRPEDVYYNTLLGAVEMVKSGITSCFDQLAQHAEGLDAAMSAYERIGMRATVAPMITDKNYYETLPLAPALIAERVTPPAADGEELVAMSVDFLKRWHGKHGRLAVAFGPSGPQRCTDELLQACMAAAIEYDTVFHTHVLETRDQKNTAHYFYGKGMVHHLDDIGCLNERTSMAHGIWMTREEAKLARDKGAMVVHCPTANLYLGSGVAPVNEWFELGLPVGLGTDGPNGGGNQNMFVAMQLAAVLHRVSKADSTGWLGAADVFSMATVQNARVTRQQHALGTIEVGKQADLVVLDPARSTSLQPLQHPLRQIAYGETGAAVDTVLVQGRIVVEDGRCTTVDEEEVYRRANEKAAALVERIEARRPDIEADVAFLQSVLPREAGV